MNRIKVMALTCAAVLGFSALALAHSPICSCFDEGDGTVLCEGGFSDGSSASGVKMHVLDGSGKSILEGKMDANSEFVFDKPAGDYTVVFDGGEGHEIEIPGSDIVE